MRPIPDVPWRAVLTTAVVLALVASIAWELRVRAKGYAPTLNDTPDLWAERREQVKPDSIVLIGTSRMLFDMDLDEIEKGLGKRPVQLAVVGSTPYPILADLAADQSFRGTVIFDLVPAMYMAPDGPLMANARRGIDRLRTWSYAQRWSHELGVQLEQRIAFLQQEDLTLAQLLGQLPIPNRAGALVGPPYPPYFYELDRERRARMFAPASIVGSPLQQRVTNGWIPLFTLPPPPSFIPLEQFKKMMGEAIEKRFKDTANHIAAIRARGGKVVIVRLPVAPQLRELEEKIAPFAPTWGRLVSESGAPAINFLDHPELNAFECPEWSHLSAEDSVEFTKRLVPHLRRALATVDAPAAAAGVPAGGRP